MLAHSEKEKKTEPKRSPAPSLQFTKQLSKLSNQHFIQGLFSLTNGFQCWSGQSIDGVDIVKEEKVCQEGTKKCKNSTICKYTFIIRSCHRSLNCAFQVLVDSDLGTKNSTKPAV